MKKQDFFEQYRINETKLQEMELDWNELLEIIGDFEKKRDHLNIDANYLADRLRSFDRIHTVKSRIKDPGHLIEKIIRIKRKNPDLSINRNSYSGIINDLAGVRALHLFKEDWVDIHQYIVKNWELKKTPVANVSVDDSKKLLEKYKENGCEIKDHPYGYRSVHYVILFERSKTEKIPIEIQVRTILEEAWSEIDHLVRYPYSNGNRVYSPYLNILNRLIAQADEVSSFIHLLKINDNQQKIKSKEMKQLNKKLLADIHEQLNESIIEKNQKKTLKDQLKNLEEQISRAVSSQEGIHTDNAYSMYAPRLSKSIDSDVR